MTPGASLALIGAILAVVAVAAIAVAARANRPGVVVVGFVLFSWSALALLFGSAILALSAL